MHFSNSMKMMEQLKVPSTGTSYHQASLGIMATSF